MVNLTGMIGEVRTALLYQSVYPVVMAHTVTATSTAIKAAAPANGSEVPLSKKARRRNRKIVRPKTLNA
jgi:hypothetical protein